MTAAAVLPRPWRAWAIFARVGFINILAFRLRYYTGVVTYLANVTVYYFIWKAPYANSAEFAAGFSFPEMVSYVAVGWVIRSVYFNNIDQTMAADVQNGDVSLILLKPVSAQARYIGQALGEAAFRLILLTTPTAAIIALIFPVQAPASALHAAAFAASLLGSVLLSGALNFLVGVAALRMMSILGLLRAKFYVQELLSGLLVPMTMFPAAAQSVLAWLPFQHVAYTPLRIYLGKLDGVELAAALALQWFWAVALLLLGAWGWRVQTLKTTIQGG